jgi:CheY-like chemotaxis protein
LAAMAEPPPVVETHHKRVLVVDDEDFVREAFCEVIGSLGVGVAQAANGKQAIDHLHKGGFALVVLDINLPGISGLRVLEWINQNAMEIPVLIVTGIEEPPDVLSRFPNLVKFVEKKPVPNDVLVNLVQTYALDA